jgi:hypothetical protein
VTVALMKWRPGEKRCPGGTALQRTQLRAPFFLLGDVRVDEVAARGKSGAQEAPHSKEYSFELRSFRSVTFALMKWLPGEKVVASLASSNAIASRPATAAERDLAA